MRGIAIMPRMYGAGSRGFYETRFQTPLRESAEKQQAEFLERNPRPSDGAEEWFGQATDANEYQDRYDAWNERMDKGAKYTDPPRYVERPSMLEPGGPADDDLDMNVPE